MDIELPIPIQPQPDDITCGPTCLHAVLNYYGDDIRLEEVLSSIQMLKEGGTLAVFLACAALKRGYKSTIYTYNLQMFDPTWFKSPDIDISAKLKAQAREKSGTKLQYATQGYLEFLLQQRLADSIRSITSCAS